MFKMWESVLKLVGAGALLSMAYIIKTYTYAPRIYTSFTPEQIYKRAWDIEREKLGKIYIEKEHLTKEMYNLK